MELKRVEGVLEVNNLNTMRDFINVRDAVCAYETLLLKGKSRETYEIASGINRSLGEIIQGFKSIAAVDFAVETKLTNINEELLESVPEKLINLGWKPAISFETSIKDILHFYRSQKE